MSCKQNDEFFEMRRENMMHRYRVEYIDRDGRGAIDYVEGIGMVEAIETFIDTYCPVQTIVSVYKHQDVPGPIPREQLEA
jgi:hypothetical protein